MTEPRLEIGALLLLLAQILVQRVVDCHQRVPVQVVEEVWLMPWLLLWRNGSRKLVQVVSSSSSYYTFESLLMYNVDDEADDDDW